ncbi:hypothetical protein OHU17_05750 [Streptomyces goshikiensis]|uniref:Uncharacterized protein n=1 Tax=Streptomyces goshikiensis TaxID=1942 RepID=A0ABZ1RF03_9ACTN|nr:MULTISPECIES: hypothetical protein [Streptomyces]MBP0937550.1 hypothetical protein [Streptomyces sp. KCTC 0041BP]GHD63385.1 hypothetical protein GCM10010336_20350 [Streptomyces goshikiensis]
MTFARHALLTLLLLLAYLLVLVLGLLGRLFGDPLRRRPAPASAGYWRQSRRY